MITCEEIRQEANIRAAKVEGNPGKDNFYFGFREGAKWSDKKNDEYIRELKTQIEDLKERLMVSPCGDPVDVINFE